ncbi:hypothetical protein CWB79_06550 [Pseudoalteromonas sp. S1649]|nr:hypothetical protein CWB80_11965 [Pseudoalteromonas sp. S1650]TMP68072.1 hypothetical protein CWB79_06550 [Pseudoalteromonas sp. S1649]
MLAALKIFHLEQLNSKIFALLSTRFSCLKVAYLIKLIDIACFVVCFILRCINFFSVSFYRLLFWSRWFIGCFIIAK